MCDKGHEQVIIYEKPNDYYKDPLCNRCTKRINTKQGVVHCAECWVDYCMNCAVERIKFNEAKKLV